MPVLKCFHLLDTTGFAGTERHVLLLMRRLADQDMNVQLLCCANTKLWNAATDDQLTLREIPARFGLTSLFRVCRLIKFHQPDVIHAHNGRTQLMGAVANLITGVPFVATQHFIEPQFSTYRGMKRIVATAAHAWVNSRVSRFVAVSDAARTAMINRESLKPEKILTIVNGIDPIDVPPESRLSEIRKELAVVAEAPLIVTVARLVPEKGLLELFRAFVLVKQAFPTSILVIVGEGLLERSLRSLAEELAVLDAIRFTGFRADATDFIAAADVFVLASPSEPFGLVLLEAMALGKPVVAIASGGPIEIVVDGLTGHLADPGQFDGLAKAIIAVLGDPERGRLGDEGRQRFERIFSSKRMASELRNVYAQVVSDDRGDVV